MLYQPNKGKNKMGDKLKFTHNLLAVGSLPLLLLLIQTEYSVLGILPMCIILIKLLNDLEESGKKLKTKQRVIKNDNRKRRNRKKKK